jgi:hypothetical protein
MIQRIKDKVIAITSYCDTKEKLDVLITNISIIRSRFPDYDIALHANYPLDEEIQKSVDIYFYEDLNYTDETKWIYYWNIISENNVELFNRRFYYSIQDTGFSVFQQIRALTNYLMDYEWVMLINYDTSIKEIRENDYTKDYDLTVHNFPGQKAYSLIMMYFNTRAFSKVTETFTIENWEKPERIDQLNEERFFDMVNEVGISIFSHDYKVSDKVSGEPDYLNPNAPTNPYFTNYLLYHYEDVIEIYLWGLSKNIRNIEILDEYGNVHKLHNKNQNNAFECTINGSFDNFKTIEILNINDVRVVAIHLEIKKGYSTRPKN